MLAAFGGRERRPRLGAVGEDPAPDGAAAVEADGVGLGGGELDDDALADRR
jgi:hypothetical protein